MPCPGRRWPRVRVFRVAITRPRILAPTAGITLSAFSRLDLSSGRLPLASTARVGIKPSTRPPKACKPFKWGAVSKKTLQKVVRPAKLKPIWTVTATATVATPREVLVVPSATATSREVPVGPSVGPSTKTVFRSSRSLLRFWLQALGHLAVLIVLPPCFLVVQDFVRLGDLLKQVGCTLGLVAVWVILRSLRCGCVGRLMSEQCGQCLGWPTLVHAATNAHVDIHHLYNLPDCRDSNPMGNLNHTRAALGLMEGRGYSHHSPHGAQHTHHDSHLLRKRTVRFLDVLLGSCSCYPQHLVIVVTLEVRFSRTLPSL
jgi:hypothetical protein